jgi:uncharacterized membrane protein YoaK (UPF0700 family)
MYFYIIIIIIIIIISSSSSSSSSSRLVLVLGLLNATVVSLGGSRPYTSTYITNKNKFG